MNTSKIISIAAHPLALAAFACALAAPTATSARTVYDAGAALHAHIASGNLAGTNGGNQKR